MFNFSGGGSTPQDLPPLLNFHRNVAVDVNQGFPHERTAMHSPIAQTSVISKRSTSTYSSEAGITQEAPQGFVDTTS